MKVLVCGGRNFTDVAFVNAELDRLHAQYHFDVVIEGDARGVDRIAGEWRVREALNCWYFLPTGRAKADMPR